MPKYFQISKDLYLIQQDVKVKKIVTVKTPINHIWIYDRSGSMSRDLSNLIEQLIMLCKSLPKGDTFTLGWFSGQGDYNFILKGFKISDESDYNFLEKTIRNNSTPRNTTCFSEILVNTETVINDLTNFSKVFSLHFFTDGYPVVSNYSKEINDIENAINKIKGKIHTSMLVGYGTYYNKELMTSMAEKLGALLIHSSLIPEYKTSITKLIKLSENSDPKQEVEPIVQKPISIFSITDQGIVIYSLDKENKLYITPEKGKSTTIWYISNEKPNTRNWDKVTVEDFDEVPGNKTLDGLYSAALVLTQQMKTDIALEVSGKIGDKKIIDLITNAFTIEEYGEAEKQINNCIFDISERFTQGLDRNYVPPSDAFCTFDLLNLLMSEESSFFPYHEKCSYEKIGVATTVSDNFPTFIADSMAECKFENLVWHAKYLNLSVQTQINGYINLKNINGKKPKDLGFSQKYPTNVYRNFAIIKDGRVNFKKFFVKTSEKIYKILKNKGLVEDDTFKIDGVYAINISTIPTINRKIAIGRTCAKDLCRDIYKEQQLKAKLKSLKYLKGEETEEQNLNVSFTNEQVEFLEANGINIKRGSFEPPTIKKDAVDQYVTKTFEIKISGLSTLPTVKKVLEKIASKKNRTPVEALVEEGITEYDNVKDILKTEKLKLAWFEDSIEKYKKDLWGVRKRIQETKFAVILGKKWFDEFSSRDQTEIEVDGLKFKFELSDEVIDI